MKYCTKCGKELMDEAVICPGCGCYAEEKQLVQQDYKMLLRKTRRFLVIGLVFLTLGLFALFGTSLLKTFYVVIGEQVQSNIFGVRPGSGMYSICNMLADWSAVAFFLVAEILFILPREKFNSAFKLENGHLLARDKAAFKKAAIEKSRELNNQVSGFYACWVLAIVACALFVISLVIPNLGL